MLVDKELQDFLKINLEELNYYLTHLRIFCLLGYWITYIEDNACDCTRGQRLHQSPFFGADMGSLIWLYHFQSCGLAGPFRVKSKSTKPRPGQVQDLLHVYLVLLFHPYTPHPHSQRHPVSQPHPNILEEPDYDSGSLRHPDVFQCLCDFPLDHHGSSKAVSTLCGSCCGLLSHLPGLHLRVLCSLHPSP